MKVSELLDKIEHHQTVIYQPVLKNGRIYEDDSPYVFDGEQWNLVPPPFLEEVEYYEVREEVDEDDNPIKVLYIWLKPIEVD